MPMLLYMTSTLRVNAKVQELGYCEKSAINVHNLMQEAEMSLRDAYRLSGEIQEACKNAN